MNEPLRVLIVEDNPADVDLVREGLPASGQGAFRVESAPRLSAALARLATGGIDLVLLDLGLPDGQGLDTFRRLRAADPSVPVIVLTGNMDQAIGLAAVSEGAQDYLVKGEVTSDSIARSIRHALQRSRAEERLRESERRLALALEATRDGIYDVDFRAGTTYHSPAYVAMLGYAPRELAISPESGIWESLLHPDDKQVTLETLNRCLCGETDGYDMEFRLRTKVGDWRWIESRGRLVERDPKGNPGRLVGSHRDITERRQAEESLRDSEERFRTLYENAPIGLYRAAPDGAILLANPAFVRMLGFSSTDQFMMTNLAADGFAPSYQRSQFTERIERDGTVTGLEAAWTRKDGSTIFVRESARAIRDSDGKILFYDGTVEDVTERRRAQGALAESESKYRDLVENLNDVIFTLDIDGTITYVSPPVRELAGYAPEELIGHPFREIIHPDDLAGLDRRFREILQNRIEPWEFRYHTKGGEIRCARTSSRPVFEGGRPVGITGLLSDITPRKQAELSRDRLLQRLVTLNRVTLALGQLTTLPAILRTLHGEVSTLLDANGFFISRFAKDSALITALFAVDEGGELDVSVFPPVPLAPEGRGMQSQVLRTGKPLNVPDWLEGERKMQTVHHIAPDGSFTPPPPETERGDCTKSALLVPMMISGEPIGVLQVQSNRPNAYSDEDADLLAGLANVAAVSIQNALLVEETGRAADELRLSLEGTLRAVSRASETRDPYTAGHQRRVTDLAIAIARELSLPSDACDALHAAGLTHDIGKLGIPAEILSKPGMLSPIQFDLIREHPQTAYNILADVPFPGPVAEIVLQHHERLDGSGYPRGLTGEQTLREARILAVADVVEAMASHRPYRPARGIETALGEIEQNAGRLYDPEAVQACIHLFREKGYKLPA